MPDDYFTKQSGETYNRTDDEPTGFLTATKPIEVSTVLFYVD